MKKQNIIAEGNCGLTIELTTIDQYRLTDEVLVIDTWEAEQTADQAYSDAVRDASKSGADWKERERLADEYRKAHPQPERTITVERLNTAHQNILKFVRKFALEGERISNIFDDEK